MIIYPKISDDICTEYEFYTECPSTISMTGTIGEDALKLLFNDSCTKAETVPNIPVPINIIRNGDTTIVFWNDNTKTTVTKEPDKEYNEYMAFCAALAKKIYGSTDKVIKYMEDADLKKKNEIKRIKDNIAKRLARKKELELEAKHAKNRFEKDVRRKMYEKKVDDEAAKRALIELINKRVKKSDESRI